jgi:hypothetical protein
MTRHWEAFWVFFSTGYDDPKRKSIGEDSTLTRAGRRRDGSYCGLPACLRDGGQATCPQIPGTDLKVLGFTTSVPRSRATVPCLPAAGVFLADDSARIINPPRPAVGSAATTPRSPGRPHDQAWKLWQRCSTARLVPRALLDIYLSHNVNGTNRTALTIYAAAGLCPARLRHGSRRRRGAPLIDYGAVTMGYRYTARRPYSACRRTSLCCP